MCAATGTAAGPQQQQQPEPVASFGSFQVLNLDGDGSSSGEEVPDVDAVIADLLDVPTSPPDSCCSLLRQLSSSRVPHSCILGSNAWPALAQRLALLAASSEPEVAAAAEQFTVQQLAPELLDCNPEPLAQLLAALLTCPPTRVTVAAAADAETPTAFVPGLDVASYPSSIMQLLLVGLHKLGRQWHFIDAALGQQLCLALVQVLLQPLHAALATLAQQQQPSAQAGCSQQCSCHLQGLSQASATRVPVAGQQQPGDSCCLAESLLLAEPHLLWLHRLNATASSGRVLRSALEASGVLEVMARLLSCGAVLHPPDPGSTSIGSSRCRACVVRQCLLVQLLSVLGESPSGRQLLSRQPSGPRPAAGVSAPPVGLAPAAFSLLHVWGSSSSSSRGLPASAASEAQPRQPAGGARCGGASASQQELEATDTSIVVAAAAAAAQAALESTAQWEAY